MPLVFPDRAGNKAGKVWFLDRVEFLIRLRGKTSSTEVEVHMLSSGSQFKPTGECLDKRVPLSHIVDQLRGRPYDLNCLSPGTPVISTLFVFIERPMIRPSSYWSSRPSAFP